MVKVGILGAGGMGNVHARQYRKMSDVDLYFFDPLPDKSEAFAKQWDVEPLDSPESVISKCDVVDICLPTDMHVDAGLQSISAGRATFIEKPLARSVEDCVRLMSAAEKGGVVLMPGQVVRFFAEFATGHRLVKKGAVGTPAAARTRRGGLAPLGSRGWFQDHARSGGVLLDLAVHDFDWLRWTLGEVTQVYARSVGIQVGSGPDYALTTLSFEGGAVGHVEATWMDPSGFRTTFEVAGSKGLIQHDSRNNAALRTTFDGRTFTDNALSPTDDPYYLELRGFLEAVRDRTEPPVTGYDGAMAVSIALAAVESAKTGVAQVPVRP
ncbi:MAG: Gfo/Idh/MocA family oxidoreductase [Fimbriimonadaceae bacterium]|nr:Gfo/Idh/MocA family oxidoreductase [Fimbriimonadaceae bacterium]